MSSRVYLNEYNPLLGEAAYLPISSGKLQACAMQSELVKQHYQFMPYLFHSDSAEAILARYDDPRVAAFSVQLWNEELCLAVAREVKERYPSCLIVFGGTQVPHNASSYMRQYPFVDVACRGEGELAFKVVLERFAEGAGMDGIANITWRDPSSGESIVNQDQTEFEKDLDVFPSPYLLGCYDRMIRDEKRFTFQAIIETNRGCPFRCSYCYWGKGGLSRKYRYFSLERVAQEVEWMGKNRIAFVYNADSNFGMHARDMDIAKVFVSAKERYGYPEKVVNLYGKNTDDRIHDIAKLLYDHGMHKGVGLSRQTLSSGALQSIRRSNIKLSTYKALEERFEKAGIPTFTELILGLPGETYESFVQGLRELLEASLHCQILIVLCEVYRNTELGEPEYQRKHGIEVRRNVSYGLHSVADDDRWVPEYIDYVVGTATMPTPDWKRAGVVAWMTMSLTAFRLGYFILEYLHHRYSISYMDFIEYITSECMPHRTGQMLRAELRHYEAFMEQILAGKGRSVVVEEFGDINWAIEESTFLRVASNTAQFYAEMRELVASFLIERGIAFNQEEMREAVLYQEIVIPTCMPPSAREYRFEHNFPEFFDALAAHEPVTLVRKPQCLELTEKLEPMDRMRFAKERLLWGRRGGKFQRQIRWRPAV